MAASGQPRPRQRWLMCCGLAFDSANCTASRQLRRAPGTAVGARMRTQACGKRRGLEAVAVVDRNGLDSTIRSRIALVGRDCLDPDTAPTVDDHGSSCTDTRKRYLESRSSTRRFINPHFSLQFEDKFLGDC